MSHIRKKPFTSANQSSITSFFDRASANGASSQPAPYTAPLRPDLPKNIQSSLINVGMRVRKSVPEGYKTHKTLGLEDEELVPATQPAAFPVLVESAPTSSAPPVMLRSDSSRELLPFCGLHTVGGMASQNSTPGLSAVPSLVSQTSTDSVYRAPDGLKRSYSEEMEAELDDEYEDEVDNKMQERLYARPTARLKAGHSYGGVGVVAGDFHDEDVTFLQ